MTINAVERDDVWNIPATISSVSLEIKQPQNIK